MKWDDLSTYLSSILQMIVYNFIKILKVFRLVNVSNLINEAV
jgi:hypothetical protein